MGLSVFLCLLTVVCSFPHTCPVFAEDGGKREAGHAPPGAVDLLWRQAMAAAQEGKEGEAVDLLLRLHDQYPGSVRAEESLWRAARFYKKALQDNKETDWERGRDLFRMFTTQYPRSEHYPEAYLEIGLAYLHMHFYREALIYLKLFLKRYPDSSLVPEARIGQAKALASLGKGSEAEEIYKDLLAVKDKELRKRVTKSLVDYYYDAARYPEAVQTYEKCKTFWPPYSEDYFELLRKTGLASLRIPGKEEQGRKDLYYYLNVAGKDSHKADVLFELAESYFRSGMPDTAQRLYDKALSEGGLTDRAAAVSRLRQAMYLDDPRRRLAKWQKSGDLTDPAGDAPYLAMLAAYFADPAAQDARFGLLRRYMARKQYDQAYDLGKTYLKHDGGANRSEVSAMLGDILVLRVEGYLKQNEYKKVYELYQHEYDYVTAYPGGRLLYLVGRALQSMYLYEQAAVVYYRALGLPLTEEEKVDLYFRRAEVYLARKDWPSADRLLGYLRKLYKGAREEGEVCYLSGRLAEEKGRLQEAGDFYKRAAGIVTFPEKKPVYARARLRVLLNLKDYAGTAEALAGYREQGWLAEGELQEWFGRLGDALRQSGDLPGALQAYLTALDDKMPQTGDLIQALQLHLGEVYARMGKNDEARNRFRKAADGDDALLSKVAAEHLRQVEIDQALDGLNVISNAAR